VGVDAWRLQRRIGRQCARLITAGLLVAALVLRWPPQLLGLLLPAGGGMLVPEALPLSPVVESAPSRSILAPGRLGAVSPMPLDGRDHCNASAASEWPPGEPSFVSHSLGPQLSELQVGVERHVRAPWRGLRGFADASEALEPSERGEPATIIEEDAIEVEFVTLMKSTVVQAPTACNATTKQPATTDWTKAPPRLLSLAEMGISTTHHELVVFSLRRPSYNFDSPVCTLLFWAICASLLFLAWAWLPDRWRWLPRRWRRVPGRLWWLPAPRTRRREASGGRWSRTKRKCRLEGGGPPRREVLSVACALLLALAGCAWLPVAAAQQQGLAGVDGDEVEASVGGATMGAADWEGAARTNSGGAEAVEVSKATAEPRDSKATAEAAELLEPKATAEASGSLEAAAEALGSPRPRQTAGSMEAKATAESPEPKPTADGSSMGAPALEATAQALGSLERTAEPLGSPQRKLTAEASQLQPAGASLGTPEANTTAFEPNATASLNSEPSLSLEPNVPSARPTTSRVMRRLSVHTVSPASLQAAGRSLQDFLDEVASATDEIVLADGDYTGSGTNVLEVGMSITIRAQNYGMAVIDGENTRRGIYITSGTVVLEGLNVTRGSASVSALSERMHFPANQTPETFHGPHGGTFSDISYSILTLRYARESTSSRYVLAF
jgi:hypothetical protein